MCVICVQEFAEELKELEDPSISVGRREELEEWVKINKEAIQGYQHHIADIDSQLQVLKSSLQGESCPLGNRS